MRKLAVAVLVAGFSCGLFAQEEPLVSEDSPWEPGEEVAEDAISQEEDFFADDPFADLFNEAEDISVENHEAAAVAAAPTSEESPRNIFYKPLTFSGRLEAEVGVAGVFQDKQPDFTGFLLLKNELFMSARASKNLGLNGTVTVQYPDFALEVSALYFDYLLLDRVYISGGKKTINWGYVQLFNDFELFDFNFHQELIQEKKYIPTNILSDSEEMISLHIQVPVWTGTISGVMLYPVGVKVVPGINDFVFAGSIEMAFWGTAVNLFGRKNPSLDSELSKDVTYRPPVFGLELKRTVLTVDMYGQVVVGVQDFNALGTQSGYDSIISTAGFYRYWDGISPKVGVSFEYQHEYTPHDDRVHAHRTAFLGGLSGLGPQKNMQLALVWNHQYVVDEGELKVGFIVNNALPHANWKLGLEMLYGQAFAPVPKFTLASSMVLLMDY